MSQGQPRRPGAEERAKAAHDQPIRYGDVFSVSGELAEQPVAPRDAALLQSAEQTAVGQTLRGGPAAAAQSAATINERAGHVGRGEITGPAAYGGVTVTEADLPGRRVVVESVGGQVLGKFAGPEPVAATFPAGALGQGAVTVGRALEALAAAPAGNKPVDQADAAALQVAEMCSTGAGAVIPGGVAAAAQSAADQNDRTMTDAGKIKLRDVLSNAREKLPADKGATREDAERVACAEMRNRPDMATKPGGVADAVTSAARINQERERP